MLAQCLENLSGLSSPLTTSPTNSAPPQFCPLPDSPGSSQSSFPAPSPVVLSDHHINIIDAVLAEVLQTLKQDVAQVQNQKYFQQTSSPEPTHLTVSSGRPQFWGITSTPRGDASRTPCTPHWHPLRPQRNHSNSRSVWKWGGCGTRWHCRQCQDLAGCWPAV